MCSSTSISENTTIQSAWLAVIAVGLATFSVVTTEMLPIGLLTPISNTLGISTGIAGLLISLPAIFAAFCAPMIVILSKGIDRRKILCWLLALLILANVVSALAPSFTLLLFSRGLIGLCMGGIWAIAGGLAVRLVSSQSIGLATSIIFGGVAAASVFGVPMGSYIGELLGWRWAFAIMAMFSAVILCIAMLTLPQLPVINVITASQFFQQFKHLQFQIGLLLTLLLVVGHFMVFTFIRPLLQSMSGFEDTWIAALLLIYGIASILGNFISGIVVTRHTILTLLAITFILLLIPLLFLFIANTNIGSITILFIWGIAYGGVSVSLMTWMIKAVPNAVEIATAIYVAFFNLAIALGSWLGGKIIDHVGITGNLYVAVSIMLCACLIILATYFHVIIANRKID